jgi:hypothetical protein
MKSLKRIGMMWMQTMAGIDNGVVFSNGLKKMTNWWQFTGDWDASIQRGIGLHENSNCNYQLSRYHNSR